jgi:hypothetical protein
MARDHIDPASADILESDDAFAEEAGEAEDLSSLGRTDEPLVGLSDEEEGESE